MCRSADECMEILSGHQELIADSESSQMAPDRQFKARTMNVGAAMRLGTTHSYFESISTINNLLLFQCGSLWYVVRYETSQPWSGYWLNA